MNDRRRERSAKVVPRALRLPLGNAGLVVVSVVFVLFVVEVGVRLFGFDPAAQPVIPSAAAIPFLHPSERTYAFALDQRALVEVRTNRLGLRDWEHPGNEPKKILGLGDSFTFGFGVELEESFLSVAERSLWDRAPQLDLGIYKMGLNGTSQVVQLEALKAKWGAIRPELVVLGFSEDTDIDENLVQDPVFQRLLSGDRRLVVSEASVRDVLHRRSALVRFFEARRLRDEVNRQVSVLEGVIESWGGSKPRLEMLVRSGWQRRFIDAFGDKLDAEWRFTELLLDGIRDFVEHNGARLVLFRIPSRYSVDRAAWDEAVENHCGHTQKDVLLTCGRLDPEHTAKRLEAYAERHGLSYVDPGPALKAAIVSGEPVYFRAPEMHWNRNGHERAGIVLADALAPSLSVDANATRSKSSAKA